MTREMGQKSVLGFKNIITNVRKCKKMSFNTFNRFLFWELKFHECLNFWNKVWKKQILSKLRFISNVGKVLKNKYLEWAWIIHLKHKLWSKRRLRIKLIIQFSTIQTYKKWVKWSLNETRNKVMDTFF